MFHVKQQDRLTHMFRGGWAPRSQAQPVRVCDIIVLYIMGYYVITSLIKERINMTKETLRQTVNTCLLYTSPSPRDAHESRMPSSA